jgi:hypothetical protein
MSEERGKSVRPCIRCAVMVLLTVFLVQCINLDACLRKGHQRTFGPSPPLLPTWVVPVVDALLWLQLGLMALAVWRAPDGRWGMLPILLGLAFVCLLVAHTGYG